MHTCIKNSNIITWMKPVNGGGCHWCKRFHAISSLSFLFFAPYICLSSVRPDFTVKMAAIWTNGVTDDKIKKLCSRARLLVPDRMMCTFSWSASIQRQTPVLCSICFAAWYTDVRRWKCKVLEWLIITRDRCGGTLPVNKQSCACIQWLQMPPTRWCGREIAQKLGADSDLYAGNGESETAIFWHELDANSDWRTFSSSFCLKAHIMLIFSTTHVGIFLCSLELQRSNPAVMIQATQQVVIV